MSPPSQGGDLGVVKTGSEFYLSIKSLGLPPRAPPDTGGENSCQYYNRTQVNRKTMIVYQTTILWTADFNHNISYHLSERSLSNHLILEDEGWFRKTRQ